MTKNGNIEFNIESSPQNWSYNTSKTVIKNLKTGHIIPQNRLILPAPFKKLLEKQVNNFEV
jgi:hypothetical protein